MVKKKKLSTQHGIVEAIFEKDLMFSIWNSVRLKIRKIS